jgi:DNA-binding MarR family transcriptional regulator
MYQSYLCDREFQSSTQATNIFRILRRRCWADILHCLDAIAYAKTKGKDYHGGWIKISQAKIADKIGYSQTYVSTQIGELIAVGLIETKRSDFDCYYYKFSELALSIFRSVARLPPDRFAVIKQLSRSCLRQLAAAFNSFKAAPADQLTRYWEQIQAAISEKLIPHLEKLIPPIQLSIQEDPFQEPHQEDPSNNPTPLTGACDKLEVFETSFSAQDPDPEPCLNTISLPMTAMELVSTSNPSGVEDLPAHTTIIPEQLKTSPAQPVGVEPSGTARLEVDLVVAYQPDCDLGSTARFDRQIRTYQNVDVLTAELVEIYNRIKPEHWGKCTTIGIHLARQVAALLRYYQSADLLVQNWGEACLALKASDFYNSSKFKSGTINFLLDPTKPDRISQQAQAWRDRPQVQKEQLAQKMVAASNGIPTWGNPDVQLKGMLLHYAKKEYARYIANDNLNHPDCPSLDYLKTYFGDLFKNV